MSTAEPIHPSREDVNAWVRGEMSGERAAALETHCTTCPRCGALLAGIAKFERALRSLPTELPSAAMHARVMTAITAVAGRKGFGLLEWLSSVLAVSVVGIVLTAVFIEAGVLPGGIFDAPAGRAGVVVRETGEFLVTAGSALLREAGPLLSPFAEAGSLLLAGSALVVLILLAMMDQIIRSRLTSK